MSPCVCFEVLLKHQQKLVLDPAKAALTPSAILLLIPFPIYYSLHLTSNGRCSIYSCSKPCSFSSLIPHGSSGTTGANPRQHVSRAALLVILANGVAFLPMDIECSDRTPGGGRVQQHASARCERESCVDKMQSLQQIYILKVIMSRYGTHAQFLNFCNWHES